METKDLTNEEALKASLQKEAALATSDESDKKSEYYRKKLAKEWVQHYVSVSKMRTTFKEEHPDLPFTQEVAAELLFEEWSGKAADRKTNEI